MRNRKLASEVGMACARIFEKTSLGASLAEMDSYRLPLRFMCLPVWTDRNELQVDSVSFI